MKEIEENLKKSNPILYWVGTYGGWTSLGLFFFICAVGNLVNKIVFLLLIPLFTFLTFWLLFSASLNDMREELVEKRKLDDWVDRENQKPKYRLKFYVQSAAVETNLFDASRKHWKKYTSRDNALIYLDESYRRGWFAGQDGKSYSTANTSVTLVEPEETGRA